MCFSDGMHVEVLGVYKYGSSHPSILPVSPFPNEGGGTPYVSYVWYYTIIPVYIVGVGEIEIGGERESDRRAAFRGHFRRAEAANTTLAWLSPCRRLVL
jgi:hypothetical protein